MDESTAAQQMWRYLEGQGCTRSVHSTQVNGQELVQVEICRRGVRVGFGEHGLEGAANAAALSEAVRVVASQVVQSVHQPRS